MTTRCLAVNGGGSIGMCDRLSQPSWLLVCTTIAYCNIHLLK